MYKRQWKKKQCEDKVSIYHLCEFAFYFVNLGMKLEEKKKRKERVQL